MDARDGWVQGTADDIQAERRADIASEMPCVSEADTERRPEARGVCVFVMPGRRTVLLQHAMCVMGALAADVVRVYPTVDRLPAAAELVDSERVEAARSLITERAKGAGV